MAGATLAGLGFNRGSLAVKLNTANTTGYRYGSGSVVTVDTIVPTVTGGALPYSYLWNRLSGSTDMQPTRATSSTTKFTSFFASPGERSAVYRCTVTDANGIVANSNSINVTLGSY